MFIDRPPVAPESRGRLLRAEARHNLVLAAPLIAAQLSFVGMHTVDTVMAGRLGPVALAAVAVGANVWFLTFIIFMGLFMSVSPIVAQRVGAGRPAAETGSLLRNTLLLAVTLGGVWTLLINLVADPVLDLLRLEAITRGLSEGYLRAISWAAIPFCLCFVMRNGCEGNGATRAPVVAGIVALLVNALANLPLMYGYLGFPALGAVGTAWGTVIAVWCMTLVYALLYRVDPRLRAMRLFAGRPSLTPELREIFTLGVPICASVVAEAWLFNLGALLMAHFGGSVVAAHQIAINFASLVFMVPLSIGLATAVRVGQAVGAGDAVTAVLRGRTGILLGAAFAVVSAICMALFSRSVVALYTGVPEIANLAVRFLMLAAIFQLFDCLQATTNGALRGFKDTRVPMAVTVSAYWLAGLPIAAWLSLGTSIGPAGVWCGFIVGLAIAAIGLGLRFQRRSRKAVFALNRSAIPSVLMP
ncbi:MAG: family efflux transporter [Hydrocarboniphaga sp.]|uniref:MATE family efflux transporter n=1 Tax=Hydrocarboniphaga sp. TaxID=2033016 RepID=UPI00261795C3|nr:MATE family efflux transporter [Hydrocarboniphaga sp.]MDB5969790.1 family efflux transporter [Hydrocarboniphaga sp.]